MILRKGMAFLVLVICASALPTWAADTGFLLGVGFGFSPLDVKDFYPSIGYPPEYGYSGYRQSEGNTWKVFGGYRFLEYVSVEAGFLDFGDVQGWIIQGDPETVDVSVDGWDVFAVGIIPLGSTFEAFGKIGSMSWDTKITSVGDGETVLFSESASGTDVAFGLGIGAKLKDLTIRAEGEFFKIGDYPDVSLFTLNFTYTF